MLIRKILPSDREIFLDMMRRFYNSPALITNGSEKIFAANFENCVKNSNYVEGFMLEVDGKIIGYGIIAKSFSTEFGGECIWIEDIFIEEEYRGRGYGTKFINYVKENYSDKILRLEAESDNEKAVAVYEKLGFKKLPYLELVFVGDL